MAILRATGVRRLSQVLHQASEPIFLLDDAHRIIYVNRGWEELTGFAAELVLGLECGGPALHNEPGLESLSASFTPPTESTAGAPARVTALILHASGERCWRRIEFWPLHDRADDPRLLALMGIVHSGETPDQGSTGDAVSMRLRTELLALRERMRAASQPVEVVGTGPRHARLMEQIRTAAAIRTPVLIVGDKGTGKRHVARAIHDASPRRSGTLVELDVPALPPAVLETELRTLLAPPEPDPIDESLQLRPATILIREAFQLPRDLQALVAAQVANTRIDPPRVLATSSVSAEIAAKDEQVREELYFLLTSFLIPLVPLRDRLDDLPLLAQSFLESARREDGRLATGFASDALEALSTYDWPGNLAELRNMVRLCVEQASQPLITVADIPRRIRGEMGAAYNPPPVAPRVTPLDATLEQIERRLIEHALTVARHNKSRAAEALLISRPRLYRRMRELNIPDLPESGDDSTAPPPLPG